MFFEYLHVSSTIILRFKPELSLGILIKDHFTSSLKNLFQCLSKTSIECKISDFSISFPYSHAWIFVFMFQALEPLSNSSNTSKCSSSDF